MKVKHEDRTEEVNYLSVALRSVGLDINYITADLISRAINMLEEKGGDMSIKDSAKIEESHERFWDEYAIKQAKEETEATKKCKPTK